MRQMVALSLCCALLLGVPTVASAQQGQAIAGTGATNCNQWMQWRQQYPSSKTQMGGQMVAWVQGYISGINFARTIMKASTINIPSGPVLISKLDDGCKNRGNDPVFAVATDVYLALLK